MSGPEDILLRLGGREGLVNDLRGGAISGPYTDLSSDRYCIQVNFWFKTKKEAQDFFKKHKVRK